MVLNTTSQVKTVLNSKKQKITSWKKYRQSILDKMTDNDILSVYDEFGVRVAETTKSSSGWIQVHAYGREDRNPSASIYLGDGEGRGHYKDFADSLASFSIFDFLKMVGKFNTWQEAENGLAKRFNVKRPENLDASPHERVSISKLYPRFLVMQSEGFIRKYPGVTGDGILRAGGLYGFYPANYTSLQQPCLIFECWSSAIFDSEVTGYVVQRNTGELLYASSGPDYQKTGLKRRSIGGGMLGKQGLSILKTAKVVIWVEGVSDLLILQSIIPEELVNDYAIITNASGAAETGIVTKFGPNLRDIDFVAIGDADTAGIHAAELRCKVALEAGAKRVRNLKLPFDPKKHGGKDLRDWLVVTEDRDGELVVVSQKTFQDFLDLLEQAEEIVPEQKDSLSDEFSALLAAVGVRVMGSIKGTHGHIAAWSENLHKHVVIRNIGQYKFHNFCQDFGQKTASMIHIGKQDEVGGYTFPQASRAIAIAASKNEIDLSEKMGVGVWHEGNCLILVGPREYLIWDGVTLKRNVGPSIGGRLIESSSEEWYDLEELEQYLEEAIDPKWCQDVLYDLIKQFEMWDNWDHEMCPMLAATLAMATWLQTVWEWRPLIFVTGQTDTGKTMLLEEFFAGHAGDGTGYFGSLAIFLPRPSTEAGLRNILKQSAKILILDEFESGAERVKILALARTSGRGGQIVKATSNQSSRVFGLRHMIWCSAIETGLSDAADQNRFIILPLKEVDKKEGDKRLTLPSSDVLQRFGMKSLAVMMRQWRNIRTLAARLIEFDVKGTDRRLVESCALPCATFSSIMEHSPKESRDFLIEMLSHQNFFSEKINDQAKLLTRILGTAIDLGRGRKQLVETLLFEPASVYAPRDSVSSFHRDSISEGDIETALAIHGIKCVRPYGKAGGIRIFFIPDRITRMILKGDREYQGKQIREILIRVPSAEAGQQRFPGETTRPYGVVIDSDAILSLLNNPDGDLRDGQEYGTEPSSDETSLLDDGNQDQF